MSPFDSTGAQFAWDSTSLGWAETCLRKYQYYMIEGWRPIGGSIHLEFGGAYATALEHFHKHLALGMDRDEALCEVVHEALCATWRYETIEAEYIDGVAQVPEDVLFADITQTLDGKTFCIKSLGPVEWEHSTKTRANLLRTIVWYIDHFEDDACKTVILSDGRPAVEYSFSFELGDGLVYCGHIDRLVEYAGEVYVQDQKTTGHTITPRYFESFSPSTQMSGYALAGKIIYNAKVKGVMIDAAQIAVGFSRFERGFTFRTDGQLEEWRKDSLLHIANARRATQDEYFPQNRTSCDKFGGCEFRDVCSRAPEVRPNFLRASFKQDKVWNPLERR